MSDEKTTYAEAWKEAPSVRDDFRIDDFPGVRTRTFAEGGLLDAIEAMKKRSNDDAERAFPGRSADTRQDAMRHMLMWGQLREKYGELPADVIGGVWEGKGVFDRLKEDYDNNGLLSAAKKAVSLDTYHDTFMDLHNNQIGGRLAKEAGGDYEKFRTAVEKKARSAKVRAPTASPEDRDSAFVLQE